MPTEVKHRKKTQAQKQGEDLNPTTTENGKEEAQKSKMEEQIGSNKTSPGLDIKSLMCILSLLVCGALSWVVVQQNERFTQIEEEFRSLNWKTSNLLDMEEEMVKVSRKCEAVRSILESLEDQRGSLLPQLQGLEQDVGRLKEWASGLTEKREQLQGSLSFLRDAVGQIEERTSAITKDFANKVSAVRTDVRRMDGLHSELETLLSQVGELEDKASQVEHSMIKRIGDVLAGSIDRVSNLRSASERNAQAIERLGRRIPELGNADAQISERLRELESGRARLIRTVTFASDLKPKVASIRRDFGALEPRVSDLTLRIGRLAEDLSKREQEIAELRQTLSNLTAVEGDLSDTAKQVSDIVDISNVEERQRPT